MRNRHDDGGISLRFDGQAGAPEAARQRLGEMGRPVVQYYDSHGTVDETPKGPVPVRITTAPQARCRIRLFDCRRLQ